MKIIKHGLSPQGIQSKGNGHVCKLVQKGIGTLVEIYTRILLFW